MRLTIHGFHIVGGLILSTKQQTGLDGTFHILPSLLRFSRLQTHVMAGAYHIVHLFIVVFDLMIVHLIVKHGHQGELRWWWCRLPNHVIQFFHHIFHRGSGVFHHFAHHRITVLGRHRLNGVLLFLLPRRMVGWLSLPIHRHRAQGCFHPHRSGLFYTLDPWFSLVNFS